MESIFQRVLDELLFETENIKNFLDNYCIGMIYIQIIF
jgi:hypothetical protein